MNNCSTELCDHPVKARGFCNNCYMRLWRAGKLKLRLRNKNGVGHISKEGYQCFRVNGTLIQEHRLVMEKYLGRKLLSKEVVHHKDRNGLNNDINNLQLLSGHSVHVKLHADEDALVACGHRHWRKCWICKKYDDPNRMYFKKNSGSVHHRECQNKKRREDRVRLSSN